MEMQFFLSLDDRGFSSKELWRTLEHPFSVKDRDSN